VRDNTALAEALVKKILEDTTLATGVGSAKEGKILPEFGTVGI
jgi:hypothetical protein